MRTRFVEATQGVEAGINWGKFMVALFDPEEWARPSEMLARRGDSRSLLRSQNWDGENVFVLDLATGEGAIFKPGGLSSADLDKHRVWVCPMFEPFLAWLYEFIGARPYTENGTPLWLIELPKLVELPDVPGAMQGYRREGSPDEAEELRTELGRQQAMWSMQSRIIRALAEHVPENVRSTILETTMIDEIREGPPLVEALDLLALWYSRWQGYTAGTPLEMHVRTAALLAAHGREVKSRPRQ